MPVELNPITVSFVHRGLRDPVAVLRAALHSDGPAITPGTRVAICAGSRGVANIATLTRAVVDHVRAAGAVPFIVPAMGSHGGATDEGQAAVLASYGITEETMGAPVRSSMETVSLGALPDGTPLFMDRAAYESDGVILINRIKPHTDFHGVPESGLVKMSVIGLGKRDQANVIHSYGVRGLREVILPAARAILATGKVLGGVALVEDAYDETMHVQWMDADRIIDEEPRLLEMARDNMPRLPVDDIDLLIVDRIGKDVSGTCMDTNVIGRIRIRGQEEPAAPRISAILALRLTEASHGNAIGVGLADVVTEELRDAIDFGATYANGVTSGFAERTKLPTVARTHEEALAIGLRYCGLGPDTNGAENRARIVRIRDTLSLSRVYVSTSIQDELSLPPAGDSLPLLTGGEFSSYPYYPELPLGYS